MGNASPGYASTSSNQASVRSQGSVIPCGQSKIRRGNENVTGPTIAEDDEVNHLIKLAVSKAVKDKNEAIKRVTCSWESLASYYIIYCHWEFCF